MESDAHWMRLALEQARLAKRLSPPNPSVGAVIVKEGKVIAQGFTQQVGGPHAEIMALRDAFERQESVQGATLYVTLEPCSHYGRTPPCALALIKSGIKRVVVAMKDPNPAVAGRGLAMLSEAGIDVRSDVLSKEAWEMNAGFFTRMTEHRPWVRLKCASTLDGRTALSDGRSNWITGEEARKDNQYWRGQAGAIVSGIGTVLADDPHLNVRLPDQVRFPYKVIVDSKLQTPPQAKLFEDGQVWIFAAQDDPLRRLALEKKGAKITILPDPLHTEKVDLAKMLSVLAQHEVNEVHLEAGATLNGAFLARDLVDEILLYTAPCFFGTGRAIANIEEPSSPNTAPRWHIADFSQVGDDLRAIFRRRS